MRNPIGPGYITTDDYASALSAAIKLSERTRNGAFVWLGTDQTDEWRWGWGRYDHALGEDAPLGAVYVTFVYVSRSRGLIIDDICDAGDL